ncbi:MAG: cyclic nucleotide-binding domain-containing protein [Anaerolineae bacterium]
MTGNIVARLKSTPIFAALSEEDIQRIVPLVSETHYPKGAAIVRQGERDDTFYIVDSGQVVVLRRTEPGAPQAVLSYLGPGQYFGEVALLTGRPRNATVQATLDTHLLYLRKADFDRLLSKYPHLRDILSVEAELREWLSAKRFPWQSPDEVTACFSHKHWFVLARSIFVPGLLLLLLLGTATTLSLFDMGIELTLGLMWAPLLVVVTVLAAWLLWNWYDWINDYYVVTNKRAVHVERVALISTRRDEAPLGRLQDVSVVTPGILAHFLGFGDVILQTAGATGQVVFRYLSDPNRVRERLFEMMTVAKQEMITEERQRIRTALRSQLRRAEEAEEKPEQSPLPQPSEAAPSGQEGGGLELLKTTGLYRGLAQMRLFDFLRRPHVPRMRIEEKGTITWRKHWFILVRRIIFPVFFLGLTLAAMIFVRRLPPNALPYPVSPFVVMSGLLSVADAFWLMVRIRRWRNQVAEETQKKGPLSARQRGSLWWSQMAMPLAWLVCIGVVFAFGLLFPRRTTLLSFIGSYLFLSFPLLLWFLWRWEDWSNDVYILTSNRIIDIKRIPWFMRESRRESSLDVIQNISYDIPGVIAHIFQIGTVIIETAGRAGNFVFEWVADPAGVQADIFRRMDEFEESERQSERRRREQELRDWFSVYQEMVAQGDIPGKSPSEEWEQ